MASRRSTMWRLGMALGPGLALAAALTGVGTAQPYGVAVYPDYLCRAHGNTVWGVVDHSELKVVTYLKVALPANPPGTYMWFTYDTATEQLSDATEVVMVSVSRVVQAYEITPTDPVLLEYPAESHYVTAIAEEEPVYMYSVEELRPEVGVCVPCPNCKCQGGCPGTCVCTMGDIKACYRYNSFPE